MSYIETNVKKQQLFTDSFGYFQRYTEKNCIDNYLYTLPVTIVKPVWNPNHNWIKFFQMENSYILDSDSFARTLGLQELKN